MEVDSDDFNITDETAAAIDSIVSNLDVVEELQDDVDLGLDIIDEEVSEDETNREEEIPSPQDIEINHEAPVEETLRQSLYQNERKIPVLQLQKIQLKSQVFKSETVIDLRKLFETDPELFPKGLKEIPTKKRKSKPGPKPKKAEKEPPPKKMKIKIEPKKAKKEVSQAIIQSDGDSSDSDLEELRKKIMKPSLYDPSKMAPKIQESKKPKKSEPAKKPEKSGKIFKPCNIVIRKLSSSEIEKWTKSKKRSISISSTESSKFKSKPVLSDSSSSDEEKPKKSLPNPFFVNKTNKTEAEVKQVLVEKLFSLLSNDETKENQPEKVENDTKTEEEKSEKSRKSEEKDEKLEITEKKREKSVEKVEKSSEKAEKTSEKPLEKYDNLPLIYSDNKEAIDVKKIAQLRPFADLLMIEMGSGSLSFLGNYRITIKELESIVHKAISKLEIPRPLEIPSSLPEPSGYEKAKYKIKNCQVRLKDVKDKEAFKKALNVYNSEVNLRKRRKKSKMLHYLTFLAEHRKSEVSKKRVVVSSDSEEEMEKDRGKKNKYHEEPSNQFGSFR